MKSKTGILWIGIGAVAAAVVGVALRSALRPAPNPDLDMPTVFTKAEKTQYRSKEKEWLDQAVWIPLSRDAKPDTGSAGRTAPSEPTHDAVVQRLVSAWRPSVVDPKGLLSPEQLQSLLQTIARYATAQSSADPAAYLQIIADDSPWYSWISGADDFAHYGVKGVYHWEFDDVPGSYSDAKRTLIKMWKQLYGVKGDRFASVGSGARGALLNVHRIRGFQPAGIREGQNTEYWLDLPLNIPAVQFRQAAPRKSLMLKLLEKHDAIDVAFVHILVKAVNGVLFDWRSVWILDPQTHERWIVGDMGAGSARPARLIF